MCNKSITTNNKQTKIATAKRAAAAEITTGILSAAKAKRATTIGSCSYRNNYGNDVSSNSNSCRNNYGSMSAATVNNSCSCRNNYGSNNNDYSGTTKT